MTKPKILLLNLLLTALAGAHDEHSGKAITISGTVVDTGCYVSHDSKGEAHAKCAAACAKNGVPLAILDDHGTLYMPIAVEHKDQKCKAHAIHRKASEGNRNGVAEGRIERDCDQDGGTGSIGKSANSVRIVSRTVPPFLAISFG